MCVLWTLESRPKEKKTPGRRRRPFGNTASRPLRPHMSLRRGRDPTLGREPFGAVQPAGLVSSHVAETRTRPQIRGGSIGSHPVTLPEHPLPRSMPLRGGSDQ